MLDMLKRLLAERARVLGDTRKLYELCEREERIPTAEENQELDRRNADLDDFDQRIEQLNARIQREASADEARAAAEALVRPEQERQAAPQTQDEQVEAWFRSGQRGVFDLSTGGVTFARSYDQNRWSVRDLTGGSATAGGNTFGKSFRTQLYEHLIENAAIRQTRAEVIMTGSGEELLLPKTTAHTNAGTITAEAAGIAEDDPTFGQGTLNAYKYAKFIQVSSELLQDTQVDLLGYLARSLGAALGNGSGAHMITGDGSSKPNGVITAAGTIRQVAGTASAAAGPTADNLIDLFYTVTEPYAKNGEWLMRRATVGKVRKLKDTTNQYLWQPALLAGEPDTLLGRPIVQDPTVPAAGTSATSVAFGDFSTYKIRDVGNLRFERSDEFAFQNDLVTYRAIIRTDGDLLDLTGSIGTFVHGTVA